MTDNDKLQNVPILAVPETFNIPQAVLEQWVEIPASDRVNAPLTRMDIDHLLLALLRTLESSSALDRALTEWSNNRFDTAVAAIAEARKLNVDSQNHVRQLATAIMSSAIRERHNAK